MARIFLATVGAAYLFLAGWCVLSPASTSKSVGFDLKPGSGQSEYLVIYGGLQLALGIVFLWPLYDRDAVTYSLLACVLVHGCIVLFRTLSFFLYSDLGKTTYALAAIEWVILLASAMILWGQQASDG